MPFIKIVEIIALGLKIDLQYVPYVSAEQS